MLVSAMMAQLNVTCPLIQYSSDFPHGQVLWSDPERSSSFPPQNCLVPMQITPLLSAGIVILLVSSVLPQWSSLPSIP